MNARLRYKQVGEVLIPDLETGREQEDIGKYGAMRQRFMKEHRRITYGVMLSEGTLNHHLAKTNKLAMERLEEIVAGMQRKDPGPDKATDQMGWVRHQNALRHQAEEIVLDEIVYR